MKITTRFILWYILWDLYYKFIFIKLMNIKCLFNGHIWMGESKFGNRCSRCGKQTHTKYSRRFQKQFIKLQKLNSGATFSELMELTENLTQPK